MKKKITAVFATLLCAALFCTPALAASRVPEMELDVALRTDGSAHINQRVFAGFQDHRYR